MFEPGFSADAQLVPLGRSSIITCVWWHESDARRGLRVVGQEDFPSSDKRMTIEGQSGPVLHTGTNEHGHSPDSQSSPNCQNLDHTSPHVPMLSPVSAATLSLSEHTWTK
jgi:hypothetical protein